MDTANVTLRIGNYLHLLDFPQDAAPKLKTGSSLGWFCTIPLFVDKFHQQLDDLVERNLEGYQTVINELVPKLFATEDETLRKELFSLHNYTYRYPITVNALMGLVALDYFNRHYQRPTESQACASR